MKDTDLPTEEIPVAFTLPEVEEKEDMDYMQEAMDVERIKRGLTKQQAEMFDAYIQKRITGEQLSAYRLEHNRRELLLKIYQEGLIDIISEG